ncbi:uncharacterized protein RHO25_004127 [Cercospora beticola]|uniref:SnoaL-like domain-containing protein n=1 Tax=Cercospora beticola TaxID=122368 RepID=A0ABZ0NJ53_CERBT|nr:hypothetical protein RHO25_004127 [Cercospora beticola]
MNDGPQSVGSEPRERRCAQCTKAASKCACAQQELKFRIYQGPSLRHVNDDARAAEWVKWLTMAFLTICDARRWDSPFLGKYLSRNYTHLGFDVDVIPQVADDSPNLLAKLCQHLRCVEARKPNYVTKILDCQVTVDRQKGEAVAWVLTRQWGMFTTTSSIGQESLIKYKWLQRDGGWKCYGYVGIRGPGGWASPDLVPIDTAHFLQADSDGSLLRKNEHNFNNGRALDMSATTGNGAKLASSRYKFINEGSNNIPCSSLDTAYMLIAESKRHKKSSVEAKAPVSRGTAGWLSAFALFPHADTV